MSALLVGVLVVLVSSAGFAAAMFGRRPLPQPAMRVAAPAAHAVTAPRRRGGRIVHATRAVVAIAAGDDVDEEPRPAIRIDIPATARARSVLLLAAGVIGAAALLGLVWSLVVVGFFTLLN